MDLGKIENIIRKADWSVRKYLKKYIVNRNVRKIEYVKMQTKRSNQFITFKKMLQIKSCKFDGVIENSVLPISVMVNICSFTKNVFKRADEKKIEQSPI